MKKTWKTSLGGAILAASAMHANAGLVDDDTILWLDGIVPFTFESDVSFEKKQALRAAARIWSDKTNVEFIEILLGDSRYPHAVHVHQTWGEISNETEAGVGHRDTNYIFDRRALYLPGGKVNETSIASALRELGTVLGLKREHQRPSSSAHLLFNNISASELNNECKKLSGSSLREEGSYDYSSIMHYSSDEIKARCFSDNVSADAQVLKTNGQKIAKPLTLSAQDIAFVNALYSKKNLDFKAGMHGGGGCGGGSPGGTCTDFSMEHYISTSWIDVLAQDNPYKAHYELEIEKSLNGWEKVYSGEKNTFTMEKDAPIYRVRLRICDDERACGHPLTINIDRYPTDSDNDGHRDNVDNCMNNSNANQTDYDGDGRGDVCDSDADNDGLFRWDEIREGTSDLNPDSDNDGIYDGLGYPLGVFDNCPSVSNPEQWDKDNDGIGSACDSDKDGDGVLNDNDNCPWEANEAQWDKDKDGRGNECDWDIDGDNIANKVDNCVWNFNPGQWDKDQDGYGNECDWDIDGDGFNNKDEEAAGTKVWNAESYPGNP